MGIIASLIIGAIAGWLGGLIYKGSGLGLFGNIIIGILGGGVGSWLLGSVLHISLGDGWIGFYHHGCYRCCCGFILIKHCVWKEKIRMLKWVF